MGTTCSRGRHAQPRPKAHQVCWLRLDMKAVVVDGGRDSVGGEDGTEHFAQQGYIQLCGEARIFGVRTS